MTNSLVFAPGIWLVLSVSLPVSYLEEIRSAERFSSCTCLSFRKDRVVIIEKGVRHPFVILHDEVVTGTQQNLTAYSLRTNAEDSQISEETDLNLPVLPSTLSSFKLKKMKVLSNFRNFNGLIPQLDEYF